MKYLSDSDKKAILAHPTDHDIEWPTVPGKDLALSYSKISTFNSCPLKYAYTYVYKMPQPRPSAAMQYGRAVHKSFENGIAGLPVNANGGASAAVFSRYESYLTELLAKNKRLQEAGRLTTPLFSESRMACGANMRSTGFSSKGVFLRGIADCGMANEKTLFIWDIKTGKGIGIQPLQLELMALLAFVQPDFISESVERVKAAFLLVDQNKASGFTASRSQINSRWADVASKGIEILTCWEGDNFPAKPSPTNCAYCANTKCKERNGR